MAVAISEMALAGNIGAEWQIDDLMVDYSVVAFGEDQGRYVITTNNLDLVRSLAEGWNVPVHAIGKTGGDSVTCHCEGGRSPGTPIPLADLRAAHEGFFPRLMGSELTPEF